MLYWKFSSTDQLIKWINSDLFKRRPSHRAWADVCWLSSSEFHSYVFFKKKEQGNRCRKPRCTINHACIVCILQWRVCVSCRGRSLTMASICVAVIRIWRESSPEYFSVYQLYADDAPPGEKLPFNTRVLLSSWRSASPHSLCNFDKWVFNNPVDGDDRR